MVAQGLPRSPNGGIVVIRVIFNAHYWRHRGSTRKAEALPRLRDWVLQQNAFIMWQPLADHCASILPPWQCLCIPSASFEWLLSGQPPRRPLWDCFEHIQNFIVTMASMMIAEHPVYQLWATKPTMLPPLSVQLRPGQFYVHTREARCLQGYD